MAHATHRSVGPVKMPVWTARWRAARRRSAGGGLLLASLLLAACSTLPAPPSPEVREQLGRVAIVAVPDPPGTDFHTFATSKPEGVAKGSALGASEGLIYALSEGAASGGGGPYAGAATAIAALLLALVGAVAGGVIGHQYAVPAEVATQAESRIRQAVAELRLSDEVGSHMWAMAGTRQDLASRELVYFDSTAPAPGLEALHDAGIDSVAAIEVREAGFEGGTGRDPTVHLYMTAHLRVTGTAEGSTRYERDFRFTGQDRRLQDWFSDGSRPLRQAIEGAVTSLAERMLDEMYLVTEFPFDSGLWAFPGSEEYGTCWLGPVYPPHQVKGFGPFLLDNLRHPGRPPGESIKDMIPYGRVDSLQPELRWESFPRPRDQRPDNRQVLESIGAVSYDLKVWYAPQGYPERLVYDRTGLARPEHRLEQPLAAHTRYFWSFRARYTLAGRPQATRWAYSPVPATAAGMPAGGSCDMDQIPASNYYRFMTP